MGFVRALGALGPGATAARLNGRSWDQPCGQRTLRRRFRRSRLWLPARPVSMLGGDGPQVRADDPTNDDRREEAVEEDEIPGHLEPPVGSFVLRAVRRIRSAIGIDATGQRAPLPRHLTRLPCQWRSSRIASQSTLQPRRCYGLASSSVLIAAVRLLNTPGGAQVDASRGVTRASRWPATALRSQASGSASRCDRPISNLKALLEHAGRRPPSIGRAPPSNARALIETPSGQASAEGVSNSLRRWRRRESNPGPRMCGRGVYERSRRSNLALDSPRRPGCRGPAPLESPARREQIRSGRACWLIPARRHRRATAETNFGYRLSSRVTEIETVRVRTYFLPGVFRGRPEPRLATTPTSQPRRSLSSPGDMSAYQHSRTGRATRRRASAPGGLGTLCGTGVPRCHNQW